MKTLQIELSDEQFARLKTISKLLNATPEDLAIGEIFGGFDSCDGLSWAEFIEGTSLNIDAHAGTGRATMREFPEDLIENHAPAYLRRRMGLKPSCLEVPHA